ncbi:MAG: fimbrial protein [Bacteroidales bacterium]|uniref:fimbrial protein n=1 Tax=Porphyromonas sp. TaxID=1924944 RepID=UPI0029749D93|nr:fimbrial protein [Porphyromonas sp.]MDD7438076.1 fimbrial protein [Bacteroidales bacterium]MDY3067392.1 fimbrial protein [Porphyromonas sp.]
MKKSLFMAGLMSLAMFTLVGCNKEQNGPAEEGAPATVSIKLQGAAMRAYEPGEGNADKKVYTLAAMVYNGNVQEAYKAAEAEEQLEIKDIPCTAGARKLVVVANFGSENLKGLTLTELQAKTLDLVAAHQDAASKLHMMTSEVIGVTIVAGKNLYGSTGTGHELSADPLKITHVHAGMEFKAVTVNLKDAFKAKYSLDLTKNTSIIGLIVKGQSKIFGDPLANANTKYFYGENHKSTAVNAYTPADYDEMTALKKEFTVNPTTTLTDAGFYILENNNQNHPTILCLKTKLLDKDGQDLAGDALDTAKAAGYCDAEGFTYYPVLVNWDLKNYVYDGGATAGKKIVRNNKYQITLNITGPGTNKPEEPVDEPATLDVTVEVTSWELVGQTVKW